VRTWFQKARCVVDVGAGAGWYSLVALELNPSAQVVAIEPDGLARANLEANLHLNGYCQGERITVLDQAVSPDGLSLERVLAPFTGPVAIKMDIEGGEFEALHSAGHALRRPGIALIVETHSRELEQACVAYVQELGFHTRVIRPAPWRILLPERRPIEHNRWFVAWDSTIESGVRCSENES